MIVDSDPVIRALLSFVLQNHQYTVKVVGDAEAALASMDAEQFDVLFSDLRLPGMRGLAFAAEARKRFPNIVIVLIAGTGPIEGSETLREINVDFRLEKPFSLSDVENVLEKILVARSQRNK